ncbi:MAG: FAD-dependent oxidoreductase [Endomicrobium sp.]|jgi:NAD(P)H-nitrite reductase large subunit|nr:FAD-dependent oxidoreductase [Endomicrobium sp.]
MRYLIVGNSAAGINAASEIRTKDSVSSITMISKDTFNTYGRPLISYYLNNKIKPEDIYYHNKDFYIKHDIKVLLNSEVKEIDIKRKKILFCTKTKHNNDILVYDKLLIAIGSNPILPSIAGLDYNYTNVFTFLSYEDSIKLKSSITRTSKVVILGAGLIGLKVAEGLAEQVKNVTVIDLSDRIMSSNLDQASANIIQKHMENHNIKFQLKSSITNVNNTHNLVTEVILSTGDIIACDILIIAIGVLPNLNLAYKAGLKVNKGIIVNEYLQTSNEDIYAAGDCVESVDLLSNKKSVFALWTSAANQGKIAGENMSQGNHSKFLSEFAMNAISFFGMHILSAGVVNTNLQNIQSVTMKCQSNQLCRLNILNNNLVGFIMINENKRAGIYTALIRNKTQLSSLAYDITNHQNSNVGFNVYSTTERKRLLDLANIKI